MTTFKMIKEIYNNLIFPDGTPTLFIAAAVFIGILISPLLIVAGVGFGFYTLFNLIKNGGRVKDTESESEKSLERIQRDADDVASAYANLYPVMKYLPGASKIPTPVSLEKHTNQIFTGIRLTSAVAGNQTAQNAGKQIAENADALFDAKIKEYKKSLNTLYTVGQSVAVRAFSLDQTVGALEAAIAAFGGTKTHTPIDNELQKVMKDINTENCSEKIQLLKDGIQGCTGLNKEGWEEFYGGYKLVGEGENRVLKLGGEYGPAENNHLFVHMQELEYLNESKKNRPIASEAHQHNQAIATLAYVKHVRLRVSGTLQVLDREAKKLLQNLRFEKGLKRLDLRGEIDDEVSYVSTQIKAIEEVIANSRQNILVAKENGDNVLVSSLTTLIEQKTQRLDYWQRERDRLAELYGRLSNVGTDIRDEVAALIDTIKSLEEQKKGADKEVKLALTAQIEDTQRVLKPKQKELAKLIKESKKENKQGLSSLESKPTSKRLELTPERKDLLIEALETEIQNLDKLQAQLPTQYDRQVSPTYHGFYTQIESFFTAENKRSFNNSLQKINVISNALGYSEDRILSQDKNDQDLSSVDVIAKEFEQFKKEHSLDARRERAIDKIKHSMEDFYVSSYTDLIMRDGNRPRV